MSESVTWIHLFQHRQQWWAIFNMVIER